MKKSLKLKKETVELLEANAAKQMHGGGSHDEITTNPTDQTTTENFTKNAVCQTTEGIISVILETSCVGVTVVTLTKQTPTVQTDCDSCTCFSRWCD